MISRTSKYALHILGYLVQNRETWVAGQEIAKKIDVPANYLGKILNQLAKNGFVNSRKGWGGGFSINEEALSRSLQEVLKCIEGPAAEEKKECVYGLGICSDEQPCPLHVHYKPIRGAYEQMLGTVTVGELRIDRLTE